MLLTDATLASARATLERMHTTTAQLSRLTETTAADGTTTQSWTLVDDIACRVETDMGDRMTRTVAGAQPIDRPVYDYPVFAAHDADVRRGDRLTLAGGIVLSVQQASRGQSQPLVSAYGCTEVG